MKYRVEIELDIPEDDFKRFDCFCGCPFKFYGDCLIGDDSGDYDCPIRKIEKIEDSYEGKDDKSY